MSEEDIAFLYDGTPVEAALDRILGERPSLAIAKLGARGCLIGDDADTRLHVPGWTVEAIDATGAGDAFSAGFILSWLRGAAPEEAGRYANAVGALTASGIGAIAPQPDQGPGGSIHGAANASAPRTVVDTMNPPLAGGRVARCVGPVPTGAVIHDRQVLHETWHERAREIVPARNRDVARGRNGVGASAFLRSEARAPLSTLSVVRRAVEHLEERRTMFSANDLCARNGDSDAHARASGRDQHGCPPRPGRRRCCELMSPHANSRAAPRPRWRPWRRRAYGR